MNTDDSQVWRAGDLLIDVGSATVKRNGEELQVTGLSFDLLVALVRAAPRLLSMDELIDAVWQGRVVSPETIVQRVKLLRDALGDDAAHPQYVGLVKRRGYKLLPAAEQLGGAEATPAEFRFGALHYLGLGALVLLLSFLLLRPQSNLTEDLQPLRAGIAVLPFSSQGTVPEGGNFFAAGVHDDIITELARIEDLLVISRTSVLEYLDVKRPIPEIGRELNVDKILEGNVQRTADKVKINVQLIDAESDRHMWAQGYERDLSVASVINTQRQIAVDVARELQLSLSNVPPERAPPTESLTAYDDYLSARQSGNKAADALQLPGSRHLAQQPLEAAIEKSLAAIEKDPDFVEAHAMLSALYSVAALQSVDGREALLNKASAALLAAVQLDPDLPNVRLAMSQYYFGIGEQQKSLLELRRASAGLPQDTGLLMALSIRTLMAGLADEALSLAETAVAQDPLNTRAANMLVIIRYFCGDLPGARRAVVRAQTLSPDNTALAYMGATFNFATTADVPAYRAAIKNLPVGEPHSVKAHWEGAFLSRDYPGALSILEAAPGKPFTSLVEYTPLSYLAGITHQMAGNHSKAVEAMSLARAELEALRSKTPGDPRALATLAGIFAVLGEQQSARDAVQAVLDSPRYQQNAMFARTWRRMLIEALILNGDIDDALELFEVYAGNPSSLPIASLTVRPTFDQLRSHPRFVEIVRQAPKPLPSGGDT